MLVPSRSLRRGVSPLFSLPRVARSLACVMVVGVALAGCGSVASSTVPSGSGGGAAIATPTPTQRPPYIYVAIGASETFGTGADDPATQNWPMDLSAHLPQDRQLINLGIPGITAPEAIRGELPEALDVKPDLVTVWLGTNDIKDHVTLSDYQQSLDKILTQLTADGHPHILVANIPDLNLLPYFYSADQKQLKAVVQAWNAVVAQEVSAHHDILVNIYAESSELVGHPDYLSGDGLHPSTVGYQLIANFFYQVLQANGII